MFNSDVRTDRRLLADSSRHGNWRPAFEHAGRLGPARNRDSAEDRDGNCPHKDGREDALKHVVETWFHGAYNQWIIRIGSG